MVINIDKKANFSNHATHDTQAMPQPKTYEKKYLKTKIYKQKKEPKIGTFKEQEHFKVKKIQKSQCFTLKNFIRNTHTHTHIHTHTHARTHAWDMGYFFATTPSGSLVPFFNRIAERLRWGLQKEYIFF